MQYLLYFLGLLALTAGLRSPGTLSYSSPSAFGFVRLAVSTIFHTWLSGTHVEMHTASLSHLIKQQLHKHKQCEVNKHL